MKTRVSYYREALSVVLNLGMSEIAFFVSMTNKIWRINIFTLRSFLNNIELL